MLFLPFALDSACQLWYFGCMTLPRFFHIALAGVLTLVLLGESADAAPRRSRTKARTTQNVRQAGNAEISVVNEEQLRKDLEDKGYLIPQTKVKTFFDAYFNQLVVDVYLGKRHPEDVRINSASMLWYAVDKNLPECASFLIGKGAKRDAYRNGETLVYRAARTGNLELFRMFFGSVGASDARCQTRWKGVTGLLKRAMEGGNKKIVKEIMEVGGWQVPCAPNKMSVIDNAGMSGKEEMIEYAEELGWKFRPSENLLRSAAGGQVEMVKYAEKRGGSVNYIGAGHYTPLMTAAYSGNVDCIQYVLEKVPDKKAMACMRARNGNTALMCAAASGNAEAVSAVKSCNPDLNAVSEACGTALDCAAASGNPDSVRLLMSAASVDNKALARAACIAARFGHADIVRQLSADVNAVCEMRIQHSYPFEDLLGTETVVEVETTTPFLAAIGSGNLKLVEEMFLNGADVNVVAFSGETMLTPLRSAARRGQPDVLKFLLPRVCPKKDPGALNEAAQNGNLACVRILVENGWDVNAVEPSSGLTAVEAACCRGSESIGSETWTFDSGTMHAECVRYLISKGAEVSGRAKALALHDEVPLFECASLVWTYGAPLSSDEMRYPLHRAAQMGNPHWVEKLIRGLDAQTDSDDRNSPLFAVSNITDSYIPMTGCPFNHAECHSILQSANARLTPENQDYLYRNGVNPKFASDAKKLN